MTALRERRSAHAGLGAPVVFLGLVGAIVGLAVTMERTTYNIWGAFWVGPLLVVLSVPVANHAARATGDAWFGRIVMLGATVKVIGASAARYWADFGLYGGSDATKYHEAGVALAPLFRSGQYADLGKISGTRFAEVLTGQVYALIGPTRLGGFMVFSWLAFLGLYLFWRAFCIAMPSADRRRYALLVFFFPTLLLWTSGTGKDAWMILCLGAASWAFVSMLHGRWRAAVVLGLALWGAAVMRPHLVLIFLVAAAIATLVRLLPATGGVVQGRRGSRALLVAVVALATVLTVGTAEEFLGLDDLDVESAREVTERVATNTSAAGATYEPTDPGTPVGYVRAAVTVLFRPFPLEVPSVQGTIAAMEGVLLLLLLFVSLRRLVRLPLAFITMPYVAFATTYAVSFVYAFASIANFGILARQRAQLLPVFFIILALSATGSSERDELAVEPHDAEADPARREAAWS